MFYSNIKLVCDQQKSDVLTMDKNATTFIQSHSKNNTSRLKVDGGFNTLNRILAINPVCIGKCAEI